MFQVPKTLDFIAQITALLTALGATDAEVKRALLEVDVVYLYVIFCFLQLKKYVPAALEARKRKKEEEGDEGDDIMKKRLKVFIQ